MTAGPSTEQIRVELLAPSLFPGGAERQMLYLAAGLPKDRFRARFLLLSERGPLADEAEDAGVEVHVLGLDREACIRPGFRCARMTLDALRRYRALTRDSHIVDAWTVPAYTFAGLARHVDRIPVVLAGRRSLPDVHRNRSRLREVARSIAGRGIDAVVANSHAAADAAVDREGIDAANVHVIPNAVLMPPDLSTVKRMAVRTGWAIGDEIAIGCVSSFRPGKGHDVLLEVAARMALRRPDVRFVLVGDGPLRGMVEQQIRERNLTNVVVDPNQRDARSIYGALDMVVQASETEGLPNAVLEAAAAGRPIVATAVGGTSEILTDGVDGLLVARRNPDVLYAAIERLIADPALGQELAGRARLRARDFSTEALVGRTAALYETLLTRSSARVAGRGVPTAATG